MALQYCVKFLLHKHVNISSKYPHVPSLLALPPTPGPTPPLQVNTEHGAERPVTQQLPTSYPPYTRQRVNVSDTLSIHPTLSFPPCVHKSTFYACISFPALQTGSSASFF